MEVTDENLATLANYLQQTLNPDINIRQPAEKFLESVEVNQNYAILLLHLIDKETVDLTIRVAAAIAFKNLIKRNWPVEEDGVDRIHASDRATIKTLIVSLMLKSPEAIQRQFSDALSIIGKCDFPEKRPSLIPEMVEKFGTENLAMEPYAASSMSNDASQNPLGHVTAVYKCQTNDASKLCVHDALSKLKDDGDFDIGGTYAQSEPEFWFFYTTSVCHGGSYLLNLFVCHRKTGSFAIDVASSNELTQRVAPEDDVPHLLLPETMTKYTFKSTKPNKNFFIKTYCFTKLERFNQSCTLFVPVKITVNPKFVLNINVVKSIKLQLDLSGLLTKQETTDFELESATHKKFPTHKILLAAHSPVLRNMLKNSELTSMFIDISDHDMELLIQFIYTGTIKEVMKQDCLKLLEIADKFQLTQLFTLTQHVIGDQITVNNAVEMAVIAKKYKLEDLQKRVFAYIAKHPKVLETEAWNDLTDVELTKYLFRYTRSMKE